MDPRGVNNSGGRHVVVVWDLIRMSVLLNHSVHKGVNTSNPLLFISDTIDPVTSSLEGMIVFFPGAGTFY